MQLCEYVFPIGLPLYVPKNGFFGGFEGEDVKILYFDPKRHYPAWIRVCWCIAWQNRFNGLSSRSVERFLRKKKEIKKKLSGNFGYMGRSNPLGDLDQMWRMGRYGRCNHVCNIWWLSVKGCGCGERGKFAFSHWLDASPLQHWSHYTVWPCDRMINHLYLIYRPRRTMLPLLLLFNRSLYLLVYASNQVWNITCFVIIRFPPYCHTASFWPTVRSGLCHRKSVRL